MEFTQEQISEIISEITNGHQGLDGLVKQGLEIGGGWFVWLTTTRSGWRKRMWKKSDSVERKVSERRGQGDMTYPGQDGSLSGEMPSVPSVFPSISVCPVFCGL